ncbi:cell envelope biogenesis protein OmpA [Cytophagales bacterium WSM2-2]|nr:cell envelope biogenesis protein OmpA [Cytophagales bacterium WSM2-2]
MLILTKKFLQLTLTGVLFIISDYTSTAQTTSGSIQGHIVDSNGEEVAGADINVLFKPTNTTFSAVSNRDGRFNFVNLNPGGPYEISIAFLGFKTENYKSIQLKLGEAMKLEIVLKDEAEQLSNVTVTGITSAQGGEGKKGSGTNIGRELIQSLPTLTRSFTDFARLSPQSANNSFAGTNFRYNNISLDGAINNDAISFSPSLGGISGTANQPGSSTRTNSFSLDAIQEVQVQIAPFDVSLGNFTGGSVNAVSRSGSNEVTGSVYAFGRNASLTGKYKGSDKVGDGSIHSSYSDYQTGFRLGFPLIKDKLFLFTNEEVTNNSVPVFFPAGSAGHFLQPGQARQIWQKLDTMKTYSGTQAHYNPGDTANYNIYSKSVKFFNRIDWIINAKHSLVIRNNTIISEASNLERSTQEFQFGNYDFIQKNTNTSTVAELKSRFGNSSSNSLIIGYTDIKDSRNPNGNIFPQIQINNVNGGRVLLGTNREAGVFNMRQRTFEFTDNFKYFTGNHTITLGTHNEFYKIDYNFINSWNGRYEYGSLAAFIDNQPARLRALYNTVDNSRGALLENSPASFNVYLTSLYAQDEVVKNKLTLSYGLRADMPIMPTGPNGDKRNAFDVNPANYGTTYTYDTPIPRVTNSYFSHIYLSPRIGFSYDAKGDRSMTIRGGSGLFSGRIPFAWLGYSYVNNGSAYNAMDWRPVSGTTVNIPVDPNSFGVFNTAVAKSPANRTELDLLDKNFSLPRVWRSNLAVDFQLGNDYQLTLEALYTKTIKDVQIKQVNLKDSVGYASYDINHVQPLYQSGGATAGRVNNEFSSVYLITNTDKGYRYQLTAQISKSYPFGLNVNAAYTYGESKDILNGIRNSPESGWQTNQALNANNPALTYSNFDIRHRIIVTAQYKKVWSEKHTSYLSVVSTSQSGSPFTYGLTSNNNLTANGQQADLFYVPKNGEDPYHLNTTDPSGVMNQAFNSFIDGDKYLSTRRGQFTERNAARTPWNNQVDIRLMHDFNFKVGEKTNTFQISLDIINFSNLISKDWGVYYFTPNTINSTVDPGLSVNTRSYNAGSGMYDIMGKYTTPTSKWSIDQFSSRWQAQVGLRYIF